MGKWIRYILVGVTLFVSLLIYPGSDRAVAQNHRTLPAAQWKKLTDDAVFKYRNELEIQPPPSTSANVFGRMLQGLFNFFASSAGKLICWSILLAIACYIIYKVFFAKSGFLFSRGSKQPKEEKAPAADEELSASELEHRLSEALAARHVRDSVRYSYLLLLRLLEREGLINYAIYKTNYDYYGELKDSPYSQSFRYLSRQYEYAWYGGYPLSEAGFDEYMKQFEQLKGKLNQ